MKESINCPRCGLALNDKGNYCLLCGNLDYSECARTMLIAEENAQLEAKKDRLRIEAERQKIREERQNRAVFHSEPIILLNCTVMGGSGYPLYLGDKVSIKFLNEMLVIQSSDGEQTENVTYHEIVEIGIAGPGTISSGGGFIGGGVGVEGAVEGLAIATILNLATSSKQIHTFITLVTHVGELHLQYGGMEPFQLRITLSKVFTTLRRLDPSWLSGRLKRLEALRQMKVLTDSEFEYLKIRLINPRATSAG